MTDIDLDAIRAGLEAYDAAYSEYINRGENRPDLAHYVWAQKVRALVAEVEALRFKVNELEETINHGRTNVEP